MEDRDNGKWKGIEGLKLAKSIVLRYFDLVGQLPTPEVLKTVNRILNSGIWRKYGVSTWGQLLAYCGFPVIESSSKVKINWKGRKGLIFASKLAMRYYNTKKRSPRTVDLKSVYAAIYSNHWVNFKIFTWNDFLDYCGLPQNRGKKWRGKLGLDYAIKQFLSLKEKHGRNPTILEMKSVFAKIYEGLWHEFSIFTWNDFVSYSLSTMGTNESVKGINTHINVMKLPADDQ